MITHLLKGEQNPAYDLLLFMFNEFMTSLINKNRIQNIISFLKNQQINSDRFQRSLEEKNLVMINIINEALTHSSADKVLNHEKLEFYGDAVLRLSASEFIDNNFKNMAIGDRSELRSQIVSDEWLTQLGKKINLEEVIIIGPKAIGDNFSKDTIIAETLEALIGAIYKCFNSIQEINLWLDPYWIKDAELILKEPYKFNAKTSLQEWCQKRGYGLPQYKIREISKIHGDPKRFSCELYIQGEIQATSLGRSHKKAEKLAARKTIEKLYKENIK
tara:strand:- start:259 stop:1080 length:822 start_codon:yes stop_codon:yes gene_type:complete